MFGLFKNDKGFSTQEIATGMTMAVLVGAVTGSASVSDSEEKGHVFNAQSASAAALQNVLDDNTGPEHADSDGAEFTLQALL